MPKYKCKGGCGKELTIEKYELGISQYCYECMFKSPSGHNCSRCNKSLDQMEFKSAVGRDSSVHGDPSKAVCDSCYKGGNSDRRCTKCNKPFKGGETYTQVSGTKAGDYHESCWEEVEQEGNNSDSGLTCEKCKKSIKKGEKWVSETFPNTFSPKTVYYCEPCGKNRQRGNEIPCCKVCSYPMYDSSSCRRCETMDLLDRIGNRDVPINNNDNIRERETKSELSTSPML